MLFIMSWHAVFGVEVSKLCGVFCQVKMGDIKVVLPCAKTLSVAQPVESEALIVHLSNCAIASAAGVQKQTGQSDWHLTYGSFTLLTK